MEEVHSTAVSRPPEESDAAIRTGPRLSPDTILAGKYRIVELLGRGGVGEVWKAHHASLDIPVAIKVLRAEATQKDAAERFLNEARAAARLEHTAIVRILDFGRTPGGEPFIVMELLEGEDLGSALHRRGRVTATKAVRMLLPVASALALAHAKGIVHRDLKPENVFLARLEGDKLQPKIVDFGIAKLDQEAHELRLTRTGELLGSPAYMAPEQARGDEVDQRGDVWSLSVVLYEMITGRQPFVGKNYNAVIHAITAYEPTPITTLGVGDEELWSILSQGLVKDPDRRWQSMRELGEALVSWLGARGITDDVTGASLEGAFRSRPSLLDIDPVLPPVSRVTRPSRAHVTTSPPRRSQSNSTLRLVAVAAVALAVGVVVGALVLRGGRGDAPAAAGGAARHEAAIPRAVGKVAPPPNAPRRPSQVESLDDIPIDPPAKELPPKKHAHSASPAPAAVETPPDLKDPFQ